jgi:hypothetical protein
VRATTTLYNILVKGIAKRIKSSHSGAIRLYEAMSQSGYDVGNMSSVLQKFEQVPSGTDPVKDFRTTESSSCYYVPTLIALTYQGNGSFLQQRGGIKLQPRLEYQKESISNLNRPARRPGN